MLMRLLISSSFLCLAICTAQADDKLDVAMKRIAELEAKNQALEQSNKEKDALLKKQGIKVSARTNKTSAQSALIPSMPSVPKFSTTASSGDNAPSPLGGFYFGVNGGYGGGDFDYTTQNTLLSGPKVVSYAYGNGTSRLSGALVGGQIGYNYISASKILVGGEFDFDWSNVADKVNSSGMSYILGFGDGYTNANAASKYGPTWLSSARARIGYSYGPILPYLTGGFAFGEVLQQSTSYSGQNSSYFSLANLSDSRYSKIVTGWTVGAGLEYSVLSNISVKTEYLYTNVGSPSGYITTYGYPYPFINSAKSDVNYLGIHQVRFGINYHLHFFDQPAPAIAAKY